MIERQRVQVFRVSAMIAVLITFNSFAASAFFAAAQPIVESPEPMAELPEHATQGGSAHETGLNWFTRNIDPGKNVREQRPPLGFMFINFALVLAGVFFLARKPLSRMLSRRRDTVALALREAEALKKEAELAIETARARIANMDAEVESLRRAVLEAGAHQAKRIDDETALRAARLREDTRAIVAHEITRLSIELRAEVVDEIVSLAARQIRDRITGADHTRLAEQYIGSLVETKQVDTESR